MLFIWLWQARGSHKNNLTFLSAAASRSRLRCEILKYLYIPTHWCHAVRAPQHLKCKFVLERTSS